MFRDYGSGLSIDELIGMQAQDIVSLMLPNEAVFFNLKRAARQLCDHNYERFSLMELWGDGESVWMGTGMKDVVVVRASGQIEANHPGSISDE